MQQSHIIQTDTHTHTSAKTHKTHRFTEKLQAELPIRKTHNAHTPTHSLSPDRWNMLLHILSLIKRIVASNINYPLIWGGGAGRSRGWWSNGERKKQREGREEVLSLIRFSGLFGGSSKTTRARFTDLNKTEEEEEAGGWGGEKK